MNEIKSRRAIKIAIVVAIIVVLCGILAFSLFKVFSYFGQANKAAASYDEIVSEAQVEIKDDGRRADINWAVMNEKYPNIVGWIYCEGTSINYPVVQGDNNNFYLDHLYDGSYNGNGSIFMDYRNRADFSDILTILYGHHMDNGSMFAAIYDYRTQEFYDQHKIMYLYTPDADYKIVLLSGTEEQGNDNFIRIGIGNEDDLVQYVNGFMKRSTFQTNQTFVKGDKAIMLCTCINGWDNGRFVLMGKLEEF